MNSFGQHFCVSIFGESHGAAVGIVIDGCKAGLSLTVSDFYSDLNRRKSGAKGTTPRLEADEPVLLSGIFNGLTTGAPITILFHNNNTQSKDYESIKHVPRPGHADFVLHQKFDGHNDYRGGGHSSGRLTVALVAAGVVAKKMIASMSDNTIKIDAILTEAGGTQDIDAAIQHAIETQDSIGGIVTCRVQGMKPGIGAPFFDAVESKIAHIVFAIPAVKGIEFGSGFKAALMTGSSHNDAIIDAKGTTKTNNAGGINGGITNGNEIEFRVAIKPTSSTPQKQLTWHSNTNEVAEFTVKGRHDLCVALRVPVVLEAATAIALLDLMMTPPNPYCR